MPNKKVLQREATQKSIMDAAVVEFAEQGYSGAQLQIIAAKGGVSKGLVTQRFGSKEGLFIEVVNRDIISLLRKLPDCDDIYEAAEIIINWVKREALNNSEVYGFAEMILNSRKSIPAMCIDAIKDEFGQLQIADLINTYLTEKGSKADPYEVFMSFARTAAGITSAYIEGEIPLPEDENYINLLLGRTDFTESAEADYRTAEIRRQKEHIRRIQKIIIKDTFADEEEQGRMPFLKNLSYDIRTAMNVITGYTGLALEHTDDKNKIEQYLDKIKQSTDQMMSAISDLYAGSTVKEESTGTDKAADFSGKKALLVEDNVLNREIAAEILGEIGLAVDTAEDGRVAVDMFKAAEGGYDVILMDIQMPEMDGHRATEEIRTMESKGGKDVPIIAMTANAFEDDRTAAINAGMNDFIAKPIDVVRLRRMLATYL